MIPSSSGSSYTIKEWKAGYYVPTKKRWVYGVLILTPNFLLFQDDDKKDAIDDITVYFAEFTEVKRENSSYMFRCVTVTTNNGKHWFGSLPNREEVFHYVEHFWKERLIGKPAPTISLGENGEQTELGRELLRLAYDSQNTLNSAGEQLAHQSDQLDYASRVVDDINNDLSIAEHLIEGLDSWLGKWSSVARVPDTPLAEDPDKPKTYPLLYAKKFNDCSYPATLEILDDELVFKDMKGKKVQSFSFKDISSIVVSTPWDVKINQRMMGKPDVNFFITSSKMVQTLKSLEPICGQKFEFEEANLPENTIDLDSQPIKSYGDLDMGHDHSGSPRVRLGHHQSQAVKKSQLVSDAEADELNQVVGNLKSMALDIHREQEGQIEKVTHLTGKVEDTTERVKSDSKQIKRLL